MKILFFIHALNSGGAERVLSLLANNWCDKGHDVTIAVNRTDNLFYTIDPSIEIINTKVDAKGLTKAITGNIQRINAYKKTMLEVEPDIVISFMTTMCITTSIAAKLANKPIILSEHTQYYFLKSPIWRFLRRVTYPHSNALAVLTAHDKDKFTFHKNVHVLENPLVLSSNHKNLKRKKTILAVGRLTHVKGYDMLLNAFSQAKNTADWELLILGEGEERKNLENQIRKLKLEGRVKLPGKVTDVEKYYKSSSIFVLSSRMEGFPMGLCEAMAFGCAPIAFDCLTGPREIIEDGKNGLLVEAENVNQLAITIQSLTDNKTKRDVLAKQAEKLFDRLSIDKISANWFKLINDTLNSKK